MKKSILLFAFSLLCFSLSAQDKLIKHTGEELDVKVVRLNESVIIFRYAGEDAEQTIGRPAVKEIVYASGRKESISEKIVIASKEEWEKVLILTDAQMVMGLKKGEEIRGKTSGVMGFHTAASADKKAMKKLQEAAAEAGAPFVLITTDNDARSNSIGLGAAQGLKKGYMYTYK
jgi:5S rRNA maturation endonuclease (ribonuclease M5)